MKLLGAIGERSRSLRGKAALLAAGAATMILLASFLTGRDRPRVFAVDQREINRTISAEDLALMYVQNRRDFEVVDLRSPESYERGHIKNAIQCTGCHADRSDARNRQKVMPDFNKKIILYTETGKEAVRLPRVLASHAGLFLLSGGYEAWESQILQPQIVGEDDSPETVLRKKRQNAIYQFFTGKQEAAPLDEPKTIKKRASHGLGKSEGC